MKGYPKTIAVVQDFINLLKMPEYKERALKDLQAIYDLQDDKAIRATTLIDENDPEKGYNTEEVDKPNPVWKQKGFKSRKAVLTLIKKYCD